MSVNLYDIANTLMFVYIVLFFFSRNLKDTRPLIIARMVFSSIIVLTLGFTLCDSLFISQDITIAVNSVICLSWWVFITFLNIKSLIFILFLEKIKNFKNHK